MDNQIDGTTTAVRPRPVAYQAAVWVHFVIAALATLTFAAVIIVGAVSIATGRSGAGNILVFPIFIGLAAFYAWVSYSALKGQTSKPHMWAVALGVIAGLSLGGAGLGLKVPAMAAVGGLFIAHAISGFLIALHRDAREAPAVALP